MILQLKKMSKSCCVLDLDSTLVDTFGLEADCHLMQERNPIVFDICVRKTFMWGTVRPHFKEFLRACFRTFDVVGVWSAGNKSYVKAIVEEIFVRNGFMPAFVWTNEMCEIVDDDIHKPLRKVYAAFPDIDQKRTLLFDDLESCGAYDKENFVNVPAWSYGIESMSMDDHVLFHLSKWIREKVSKSKNYKLLPRKDIF